MRRPSLIFCLALLAAPAFAEDAPPEAPFDDATRTQLVNQAKSLREQADTMKKDAEARFISDDAACYQKFLTNDCRDKVKKQRSETIVEARRLDSEARAIDRRVRLRDAVVHEAERREALPRRAQEQAEQAMKFRAAQEQAASERAKRQNEKLQQTGAAPAPATGNRPATPPVSAAAAARARAERQNELEESRQRMADRDKRVAEKAAERAKKDAARAAGQ